jgi:hypothetical protein
MIFINGKQVNVDEVLEMLQIKDKVDLDKWQKLKEEGKSTVAVFKLKEGKAKKNAGSGDILYPTYMLSNPIVANIPKIGQTAVFFTNTLPSENAKGKMEYADPAYQFTDWQELIDPMRDTEKYLMFYLYKGCKQSPFNTGSYDFVLEDKAAESGAKLDKYNKVFEVQSAVKAMDEEALKIFAGAFFVGVTQMEEQELRLKINEMITGVSDPKGLTKISQALEAKTTTFYGKIQIAIEQGIIRQETQNGVTRWNVSGWNETIIVPKSANANTYLKQYLVDRYDSAYAIVEEQLSGKTLATKIESKMKNAPSPVENKVNELIDNGIIILDVATKSIKFGVDSADVILELNEVKGWQKKTIEFFSDKKSKIGDKKAIEVLQEQYDALLTNS